MDPEIFYSILSNNTNLLEFLRDINVIKEKNTVMCETCLRSMSDRFRQRKDGDCSFILRCHKCKKEVSMLTNTFFATTKNNGITQKLSLKTILKLAFQYFEKKSHEEIKTNTKIKTSHTVVDWCNYIREVMVKERTNRDKIGGLNKRVQIDESLFRGKRKYNRGRLLLGDLDVESAADRAVRHDNYGSRVNGPWIFGMVDEYTNDLLMFYVEKRDSATLIPLIQANVFEGSVIVSDGWAAYRCLSSLNFSHEVVIHEENFVDPVSGAHTQRIECEWSHAKLLIMKLRRGTTLELLQSHLDEFVFRRKHGKNSFLNWLKICNNIVQ